MSRTYGCCWLNLSGRQPHLWAVHTIDGGGIFAIATHICESSRAVRTYCCRRRNFCGRQLDLWVVRTCGCGQRNFCSPSLHLWAVRTADVGGIFVVDWHTFIVRYNNLKSGFTLALKQIILFVCWFYVLCQFIPLFYGPLKFFVVIWAPNRKISSARLCSLSGQSGSQTKRCGLK